MYRVTLICKGVPIELGQAGAIDIAEEFTHRPWQQNVLCEWDGEQLLLHAESDWDADGKALLDEFSDAISACIPGTFGYGVEVKSIIVVSGNGISDQEKPSLDDADGNCRQCGHPFNPHIVVAYDMNDFSKGGEIRCPVAGCSCFHSADFDPKTTT